MEKIINDRVNIKQKNTMSRKKSENDLLTQSSVSKKNKNFCG